MINTTMDYHLAIDKNRQFRIKDRIILKNGKEMPLSMEDVTAYSINEATSANGKFEIGAAIVKEYKASLNNMDGRFDEVDFEEADISAKVGLCLMDGSWEDLRKGEFRIVEAISKDLTIDIKAYDGMLFFDRPYSQSTLSYPATINQILIEACTFCQMTLNARSVQMGRYVVKTRPEGDAMTFRDMISYCAQIMGCYAFINNLGQLDFGWYDFELLERLKNDGYHGGIFDGSTPYATGDNLHGGRFSPWNAGDAAYGGAFADMGGYHHIYMLKSQSINTNDVTITGISVSVESESEDKKELIMYGEAGYVLELSDNPLIQRDAVQEVLSHVGRKVVGNTFRPLKVTTQSDPCMEAGDLIVVTDRKQRSYWSVITNTTFSLSGTQKIECGAETPTEKNYTRYGAVTKLMAMTKDQTDQQLSAYDVAAKHFASLMARSMGLYETYETQEDGSVIKYQHDKPQLEDSKTIWKQTIDAFGVSTDGGKTWNAGTDANGNAIYNILSVIGILAEWINTRGLVAKDNEGNITFEVDANTGRVNIVANTFSLSGKTIDTIAKEKADQAQKNAQANASRELENFVNAIYDPKIASLQSQIDGQIETWYYDYQPTLSNIPASDWKTEADRAKHEGDLFFWKSKGYSYRFLKEGNTWKWQIVTDSAITEALAAASRAQDTADSKRRIFLTTPVTPYDKGDLWTQGKDGGILRCKNARSSGGYAASDWEDASGYINEDEANKIASDAVNGQTQTDILNKLTNNGIDKGIFLLDGKLYISFNAMRGDELTLGGSNNAHGFLQILNDFGRTITRIDKTGGFFTLGSRYSYDSDKIGASSFAVGVNNEASASYSSAFGYGNTVSGIYASAFGRSNTVSGSSSFAVGSNNDVSGATSCAIGTGLISSKANRIVLGRFNYDTESDEVFFIIGNGANSDGNARKNSFGITKQGVVYAGHSICLNNSGFTDNGYKNASVIKGGGGGLQLYANWEDSSTDSVYLGNSHFGPGGSQVTLDCGESWNRWRYIYSQYPLQVTSDRRQKKNIRNIDSTDMILFLMSLKPVHYQLITEEEGFHSGLIAQDVEEALQASGAYNDAYHWFYKHTKDDEYAYNIAYEEYVAPLISVFQNHEKRVKELEGIVNEQKKIVNGLNERLAKIEAMLMNGGE